MKIESHWVSMIWKFVIFFFFFLGCMQIRLKGCKNMSKNFKDGKRNRKEEKWGRRMKRKLFLWCEIDEIDFYLNRWRWGRKKEGKKRRSCVLLSEAHRLHLSPPPSSCSPTRGPHSSLSSTGILTPFFLLTPLLSSSSSSFSLWWVMMGANSSPPACQKLPGQNYIFWKLPACP